MLTSLDLLNTKLAKVLKHIQTSGADVATVSFKGRLYRVITDSYGTEITQLGGKKNDKQRQTAAS